MRKLIGGLLYGLAVLLLVWVVGMAIPRVVTRSAQVGNASVTLSADRQWVLFPGECVEVRWTLQNVHAATFFPKVEPGIDGGAGVRSVFFSNKYQPGLTITEDAAGGVPVTIDDPAQTVNGAGVGCIDYTIEPKLRAFFADGSSQSFKLGLDVFFLRMEVWLLIFGAGAAFFAASLLIRWPSSERVTRLSVWLSAALLTLYTLIFAQHPRFLTIYWLDVVPFAVLVLGAWGLSVISVARPDAFDRFVNRARASTWLVPSVLLVWLWLLAFGYYQPNTSVISELLWLPLYLWAFVAGMAILWVKRPREHTTPLVSSRSWRVSLIIALIFAGLSFARDWVVFEPTTIRAIYDTNTYIATSQSFMDQGTSVGLPKRIFPYVLMGYLTRAWETPMSLILLQSVIGALSVGALVYVLSRRDLWLGVGVGLLLTLNLSWATYNRTILTEGPFISFNLLSFAVLLWHMQRGVVSVQRWELVAAGVLYAWTFLFRGTGLVLIVPVLLVYGVAWQRWRKPLWVLAGFAAFLLGVAGFNQWRYNEFGLVGPQYSTFEVGLFSYHLFSPDNGESSARIDAALRECMGYLDYDDTQRFAFEFLIHYQRCLHPKWGQNEVHEATVSATIDVIRHRTFDFARLLVREWGVSLSLLTFAEFNWNRSPEILNVAQRDHGLIYGDANVAPSARPIPALEGVLQTISDISRYPLQPYLLADPTGSRPAIVMLAAFAMMSGAAWVFSRHRTLILMSLFFILYQVVTTTLIHYANSRYLLIVLPFMAVITVLALETLANGLRRVRPRLNVLTVLLVLFGLVYVSFANPTLRQSFTAPLSARLGVNLLEKYGLDSYHYPIYDRLKRDNIVALYPGITPHPLVNFSVIAQDDILSSLQNDQLRAWRFTRLPGYVRAAGFSHLLIDETIWASLPPFDQDTLQNPEHYRLLDEWRADARWQRLYEVVGDARGTYQPYSTDRFAIFIQPNDALHVYQLDENRNGTFALAIDPQQILNGQRDFRDDVTGWSAVLRERFGVREYTLEVYDESGALVDDGYILRVP